MVRETVTKCCRVIKLSFYRVVHVPCPGLTHFLTKMQTRDLFEVASFILCFIDASVISYRFAMCHACQSSYDEGDDAQFEHSLLTYVKKEELSTMKHDMRSLYHYPLDTNKTTLHTQATLFDQLTCCLLCNYTTHVNCRYRQHSSAGMLSSSCYIIRFHETFEPYHSHLVSRGSALEIAKRRFSIWRPSAILDLL